MKKQVALPLLLVLILGIGIFGIGFNTFNATGEEGKLRAVSLTTDKASPRTEGENITLTAEATGGKGTLQYMFSAIIGGEYKVIQNYSTSNKATWVPNSQGYIRLSVEVKDAEGNKSSVGKDFFIRGSLKPLEATSLTADKDSPQSQGNSINLKASATGGKGALEYKFAVVQNGNYKVIRDYSSSNQVSWIPDLEGYARLLFTVRDAGGVEATNGLDYNINAVLEPLKAVSLNADKVSPQPTGSSIVITGSAAGGSGQLQYEFKATNGGTTTTIQPFSNNSSVTWKPTTAGNYTIVMNVRDSKNATDSKSISYSINQPVVIPTSVSLSSTSESLAIGGSKTLSATVSPSNATDKSVTWSTSNSSIVTVSSSGVITGKAAGTATITATTVSGKKTAACVVTVIKPTVTSIKLSHTSATISAGKTFYTKATVSPSNQKINWQTSNSSVATVKNGFIYGVAPGTATITAMDSTGTITAKCNVTVKDFEPIRFAYSSPNNATLNSNVNLVAITDKTRTAVKFEVTINGKVYTVNAANKVADGNTYIWTGSIKMTSAGTFSVKSYSQKNGTWSTSADGNCDIFVNSTTDLKSPTTSAKRVSDSTIEFIGNCEGFLSTVTDDPLVANTPTIGHGKVIWAGDSFYNGLTKKEAYAMLVKSVNTGSYASRINSVLISNNVKFNQQQFDALVSFSYNLGTGWTYDSDLIKILLNSYETKATVSLTDGLNAKVNAQTGLNVRSSATTSSSIKTTLRNGTTVSIIDKKKYNGIWYKIKTSSGVVGYSSSEYLDITSTGIVQVDDILNMRSGAGTSYKVIKKLTNGARLTILDITSDGWFKVKTSDGTSGYCSGSYIGFQTSGSTTSVRNLNYVNESDLISEMSAYHHASGKCYPGLLYRRYDELQMFLYGDYVRDGWNNRHNFPTPSCMK